MKTLKAWIVSIVFIAAGCGSETPATQPSAPAVQAQPSKAADADAALSSLAKIGEAQAAFFKRNRRYALAFTELVESRDLESDPDAADTGYTLRIRPSADAQTYTLSASPALPPSGPTRHFFSDQSGVIRAELDKDATVQSPPVAK